MKTSTLILSALLATSVGAQSLPQTFNHPVTLQGQTVTVNFTKFSCRGPNFAVLEQGAGGGFATRTPGPVRTYLGTIAGRPGAIAAGIRRTDGSVFARVTFEDGVEWIDEGTGVINFPFDPFLPRFPGAIVRSGGAGSTLFGAEVGIDLPGDQVTASGGTTATALEMAEFSMIAMNTVYLRDAAILLQIERVIVRADTTSDPYTGMPATGPLLNEVIRQWDTVLPTGNHDIALVATPRVGGGLANVGVVGDPGYSSNGARPNGDFSGVTRHEIAHNWSVDHFDGGTPEGPTINSGNDLAKMSGPELELVLEHRTNRLAFLVNLGTPSIPLPPRAADDSLVIESGTSNATFSVLANDNDANGQALSIVSFDQQTQRGLTVTRNGNQLVVGNPVAPGYDFFRYQIQDAGGQTSSAVCHLRTEFAGDVLGHWTFEDSPTQVTDSSSGARHGSLVGGASMNASGELVLNGQDAYADVPPPEATTNSVTYSARIYREGNQPVRAGIVLGSSADNPTGLFFRNGNSLSYAWGFVGDIQTSLVVPDRTWTFVALVVEPGIATIYMDDGTGMRTAQNIDTHFAETLVGMLHVGHDPDGDPINTPFVRGRMDDVRVINQSLTAAQIADLAAGGRGACNPVPAHVTSVASSAVTLGWTPSAVATAQRLYASTSYTAVRDGAPGSAADLGIVTGNTRQLTSLVAGNHYWRIESTEPSGVVSGNIWLFATTSTGQVASQQSVRLGTPPNANAFRVGVTSGPVIGQTWDPVIDHTTFAPNALIDFLLLALGPANTQVPGISTIGILLCAPATAVSLTSFVPGTPFAFAIPNDPSFLGVQITTQGGSLAMGMPRVFFANALDLVIGNF